MQGVEVRKYRDAGYGDSFCADFLRKMQGDRVRFELAPVKNTGRQGTLRGFLTKNTGPQGTLDPILSKNVSSLALNTGAKGTQIQGLRVRSDAEKLLSFAQKSP